MQKSDDAAVIVDQNLDEVVLEKSETLKYHIDESVKKNINETRIKTKVGMVRVISVYVPTTVKEKKLFLEQLMLALDTIGGDFNCVEDNERDAVAKRSVGVRLVLTASRRGQLAAEEKLMKVIVEKHELRDVFFSNNIRSTPM
ncbi:unnamed protein product [Ambrosiozyma monospora]|uniref:Unnamed protein product n=1 Tax=Ambrosiozyma monospora TaxID=43982 RepID=A0ACB5SWA2_AMBMO|nr:unnamed protein product [Ambrosiozyma monospora]